MSVPLPGEERSWVVLEPLGRGGRVRDCGTALRLATALRKELEARDEGRLHVRGDDRGGLQPGQRLGFGLENMRSRALEMAAQRKSTRHQVTALRC